MRSNYSHKTVGYMLFDIFLIKFWNLLSPHLAIKKISLASFAEDSRSLLTLRVLDELDYILPPPTFGLPDQNKIIF